MRVARSLIRVSWLLILGGVLLAGVSTGALRVLGIAVWALGLIGLLVTSTYIFRIRPHSPAEVKKTAAHA